MSKGLERISCLVSALLEGGAKTILERKGNAAFNKTILSVHGAADDNASMGICTRSSESVGDKPR